MEKMIQDAHADSRLTTFLQKELDKRQMFDRKFKAKRLCGSQRALTVSPAVFLIKTETKSRYYGLNRCNSSWACPTCTPKRMAEYGTRIAAAIDALAAKYKQSACMLTLTIPHRNWMRVDDLFQILLDTWREFAKKKSTSRQKKYTLKTNVGEDKRAVGKRGDEHTYIIRFLKNSAYPQMREQLQIDHTVRVYEFTWGENGWHPHIHSLLWVPNHLFDKLNDGWSEKLSESWLNIAQDKMYKHYVKQEPENAEKIKAIVDELFSEKQRRHISTQLSTDKDGKVRRVDSSHYIAGWSGDLEVSNERKMKRAAEGHYSPTQILEKAYEHRSDKDTTEKDKWLNLYFDYMKVTFGHKRVQFSQSGLNNIAAQWMQTNQWLEVMKKKLTDEETGTRKVVCWFTDEQWSQISMYHLKTKLLDLSLLPDGRQQIEKFLNEYDIQLSPRKHWFEKFLENATDADFKRSSQELFIRRYTPNGTWAQDTSKAS